MDTPLPNETDLPKKRPTFSLEIVEIAYGGDGVGRHEGQVVFVPFTAVGDVVEVKVAQKKKGWMRANIKKFVTTSKTRTPPLCMYYESCGGCVYQHLSYPEELKVKHLQVSSILERIGKQKDYSLLPILHGGSDYSYRNRITVHSDRGAVGFFDRSGKRVLDIKQCPLASSSVNKKLAALRKRHTLRYPHYSLREEGLPEAGFAQTNFSGGEKLTQSVKGFLSEAIEACPAKQLVEGYCGSGFLTETVADLFEGIVSIEKDERLLKDSRRKKNLAHVKWVHASVEDVWEEELSHSLENTKTPAIALLNPPREGLHPNISQATNTAPLPSSIVYVSCNPTTLARDILRFSTNYRLKKIQPIDMFPRTAQVECVALLEKK